MEKKDGKGKICHGIGVVSQGEENKHTIGSRPKNAHHQGWGGPVKTEGPKKCQHWSQERKDCRETR